MTRRIWIQIAIFLVVSVAATSVMALDYAKLPSLWFGVGHYTVTVHLPRAGGLYPRSNVTYRGTPVGEVKDVHLTDTGVDAVLSLRSDVKIPSDLEARVDSRSAVGEQYVALLPRNGTAAPLKNGDVIAVEDTSVPPDISSLLDATNRGLQAIPQDNLHTAVDEAYTAIGGLGPDISRFVKGSTALAIDSRKDLNDLTNVVDDVAPVLDTQTDTADSVQAWAAHLANITKQLQHNDSAVKGVLQKGGPAADEVRALFDRLQPTLPIVLANLVSLGDVAVAYRPDLEQLLVLLPAGTADVQGVGVANRNTKQRYNGAYLSFNLNLNVPPACTTGFLPASQRRDASYEDYPDIPAGDTYCRTPQDSPFNVRGAKNYPCETKPGKRAPTAQMCESDENYVPLNDGYSFKGDPNATLSGQDVPQPRTGTAPAPDAATQGAAAPQAPEPPPAPPPIAFAQYDPATGTYVGPDGHVYTQADLAHGAAEEQTWQKMLLPPN